MSFIVDSDTHGSALVTLITTTANAGAYRMAGVSGEVRQVAVDGGAHVAHWADADYDARAAAAVRA